MGEKKLKNFEGDVLKNTKLRVIWIVPNVFCYIMLIGCLIFVASHLIELVEIGKLSIWVITLLSLIAVSLLGSFRIRYWIKTGKL